jgi:signal transduction histidine kinase/ActR/RegA family two-component response regulator
MAQHWRAAIGTAGDADVRGRLANRLFAALAIGVAALPVVPSALSLAWLGGALALAGAERIARGARAQCAIETLSRLNYAVMTVLFWHSEAPIARLFAVVIVMVDLLWLMMRHHARPRIFLAAASPMLALSLAGAADVVAICFRQGRPGLALTALMGPLLLTHFVLQARLRLARWQADLAGARAAADERGVAAEAAARAKRFFLATMSHEIRTPLNGVLGMAQAMAADRLSPVQRERLTVVRDSGQALASILDDVLDLSAIEAGRLQLVAGEFDVAELARAALAGIGPEAAAKRLAVRLHIAPGADGVYRGDAHRLRQILAKLLSNAAKFTAAGAVELALERRPDGRLCFTVRDTGPGIAEAQLQRLFERFEQEDASPTRRHGGAGLGLSIAREIAQLMEAEIEVESQLGQGSAFTLAAPLPRIGDAAPAPEAELAELDLSEVRLLAAEDNPMNQLVLKTLLGQHGLDPVLVETGVEAVAAWRTGSFDVILMDVQMPEMDGPTAARAIRAEEAAHGLARTPIVALTANAMSHQVEEYRTAGMDLHVAKPIEAGLLYDAILEAVHSRQARADAAA